MKIKDKVLIVEDEQSISSFISMILTAKGYDTIIVNTGEEALTMISSHCPDLIVLDLGLPDIVTAARCSARGTASCAPAACRQRPARARPARR